MFIQYKLFLDLHKTSSSSRPVNADQTVFILKSVYKTFCQLGSFKDISWLKSHMKTFPMLLSW